MSFPFVSVCTPTFNRRPFFPYLIKSFYKQTYPMEYIEWIIIDDGPDSVEDLVKSLPNVNFTPQVKPETVLESKQTKLELWESFKATNDKWISGTDFKEKTLLCI